MEKESNVDLNKMIKNAADKKEALKKIIEKLDRQISKQKNNH